MKSAVWLYMTYDLRSVALDRHKVAMALKKKATTIFLYSINV